MNIDGVFRNLVALGATWVLWSLIALSALAFAVIVERAVFFVRTRADLEGLRANLRLGITRSEFSTLRAYLGEAASLEAHVVRAGVEATCPAEAEELMAAEAQVQRLRSEQCLAFLGTLGNNAPFVGLLGTVIGIIGAFAELEASRGQLSSGLMTEIGEALVATAVGILVALPAVAAYNAFQRAIQARLSAADALGRHLVAHLHAREHGRERLALAETAHAAGAE